MIESIVKKANVDLHLCDVTIRDTAGDEFQCVVKSRKAIMGPWGVGCDKDMMVALEKAIISLEQELYLRGAEVAHVAEWAKKRSKDVNEPYTPVPRRKRDAEDLI